MSSVFSRLVLVFVATAALPSAAVYVINRGQTDASAGSSQLRVCADPNNLPFSNDHGEGFENALAEMAARDLGRRVSYTWWPQRRGFVRTTLRAGVCDVIMGVPRSFELARTTRPYYRSTYVFVTRADRQPPLRSIDDRRLKALSIGVHLVGDDYAMVPPAFALARRGLTANLHGFSIYGDYGQPNPPARLIEAVAAAEVDAAVAWGPLGGFFAARAEPSLAVTPLTDHGTLPFAFDISMGVRRDDATLLTPLNRFLDRHAPDIRALLARFHVPIVETAATVDSHLGGQ